MKKIKILYIIIPFFISIIGLFTIINLIFKNYAYLYILNIIMITIVILLLFILIISLFINPINKTTKLLIHYNEDNFAYTNDEINTYELDKLSNEITIIGSKLKQIKQLYDEVLKENKNYYEQYELDLESKKQLVAAISHEIKTPLAVIEATAAGILDEIFAKEEEKNELNNIINECDKTSSMLQDIVNVYKLDSKKYTFNRMQFNLANIVNEILTNYASLINKYVKKIIILNDLNFTVNLNYNLFKKALENIFLNAIIYSPKGEKITIELRRRTNYTVLEIINYGINISPSDLNKIFEPFYRIDKSRTKKEDHGNGLGLYIVKEILEKHNLDFGLINYKSGVKFYIIFTNE